MLKKKGGGGGGGELCGGCHRRMPVKRTCHLLPFLQATFVCRRFVTSVLYNDGISHFESVFILFTA